MKSNDKIAVIGAGLMGTAIATLCAAHGYRVALFDQNSDALATFLSRATPVAQSLAQAGTSDIEILARVKCTSSLEECIDGAMLVQEAIHEDLEAKQALFRRLDSACSPEVMLATNTSSFMLSDLCETLKGRSRIIGIHYVSPAHVIRAVEIIFASFSDETVVARGKDFLSTIDHVGIVCRERPGFLVNRIQYALKAEIQRMVDEGVSTVEDIDAAVRLAIGPRLALWGPFMQEDLAASKKTVLAVMDYLRETSGQVHFDSTPSLRNLAKTEQLGASSGAGWYEWKADNPELILARDKQLSELLDWLRAHDRLHELGAIGQNKNMRP